MAIFDGRMEARARVVQSRLRDLYSTVDHFRVLLEDEDTVLVSEHYETEPAGANDIDLVAMQSIIDSELTEFEEFEDQYGVAFAEFYDYDADWENRLNDCIDSLSEIKSVIVTKLAGYETPAELSAADRTALAAAIMGELT